MILLHEMAKLMYHAKAKDPVFIRIGSSGGIGIEPGTVVVSNGAVNELIEPYHEQVIKFYIYNSTLAIFHKIFYYLKLYLKVVAGKKVRRPAIFDQELAQELLSMSREEDSFKTLAGKTMCSNDFYEGQGRLDGAICEHSEEEKMEYLNNLKKAGVVNIEMECTAFGAFTNYLGIKGAIVCVTFLNRLLGDQVIKIKQN